MVVEVVDKNSPAITSQPRPGLSLVGTSKGLQNFECLMGVSPHISELKEFISVQAAQRHPVLLIGERGLRQQQMARLLHQASAQWQQPFCSVNAHSLSGEALHHLLFGPLGMIEKCVQGTIYINELIHLPAFLQQRLAAYIEEQCWRIQSQRPLQQRLIFATESKPEQLSSENRIAYGLIELLRPHSLFLKPLRERSEDIPYLAEHLVRKISRRLNKGEHVLTPGAMKVLTNYRWERNIDELEAVLESAIARTQPHQITEELLPAHIRHATLSSIPEEGIDLPRLVDDYEKALIDSALRQTGGNQTRAAKLLGLRVQTLNMKLKRFAEKAKEPD
jgi:DNA-binding NtrC family response regulator